MVLESVDEGQKEKVKKALKRDTEVKKKEASRKEPMVKIDGVSKDIEEKELVEMIVDQNKELGRICGGEEEMRKLIRVIGRRKGRNMYRNNWILHLNSKLYVEMKKTGRLNVDYVSCMVKDYDDILQCFKCQG